MTKQERKKIRYLVDALMGYKYCPVTLWEKYVDGKVQCIGNIELCCTCCDKKCGMRCTFYQGDPCFVACSTPLRDELVKKIRRKDFRDLNQVEDYVRWKKGKSESG